MAGKGQDWTVAASHTDYAEDAGLVGLYNLGNTCFLNSTLQALSCVPAFRRYFCEVAFSSMTALTEGGSMPAALTDCFLGLWASRARASDPRSVLRCLAKANPLFAGYQQQDAHEALRFILNMAHDALAVRMPHTYVTLATSPAVRFARQPSVRAPSAGGPTGRAAGVEGSAAPLPPLRAPSPNSNTHPLSDRSWLVDGPYTPPPSRSCSVVSDLFQGVLASRVTCSRCGHESVTFETCFDLSLSIPGDQHPKTAAARRQDAAAAAGQAAQGGWGGQPGVTLLPPGRSSASATAPMPVHDVPTSPSAAVAHSSAAGGGYGVQGGPSSPAAPGAGAFTFDGQTGHTASQHAPHFITARLATGGGEQGGGTAAGALPSKQPDTGKWRDAPAALHLSRSAVVAVSAGGTSTPLSHSQLHKGGSGGPKQLPGGGVQLQSVLHAASSSGNRVAPAAPAAAGTDSGGVEAAAPEEDAPPVRSWWQSMLCGGGWLGGGDVHLHDCLQAFCDEETLSGDNAYMCSKCKRKVTATRRVALARAPEVLVMHLKRFRHSGAWGSKVSTPVHFPLRNLNLEPYIWQDAVPAARAALAAHEGGGTAGAGGGDSQHPLPSNPAPFPCPHPSVPQVSEAPLSDATAHELVGDAYAGAALAAAAAAGRAAAAAVGGGDVEGAGAPARHTYALASIVRHIGGLGGGHYVALGRNDGDGGGALLRGEGDGAWFTFNDSSVHRSAPGDVADTEAYIMFYVRNQGGDAPLQGGAGAFRASPSLPRPLARIPSLDALRGALLRVQEGGSTAGSGPHAMVPLPFATHAAASGVAPGQCVFVSRWWWLRLQTCSDPGPVTCADIATDHGALKPGLRRVWSKEQRRSHAVVPLPLPVYEWLVRRFGAAGPPLWSMDACPTSAEEAQVLAERRTREAQAVARVDSTRAGEGGGVPDGGHADSTWYLISSRWLRAWRAFIDNKGPLDGTGRGVLPPGPVDNACLMRRDGTPQGNLRPRTHYRGINASVWGMFISMYGGGPCIRRATINMYDETPVPPPPAQIRALAPPSCAFLGLAPGVGWFILPPGQAAAAVAGADSDDERTPSPGVARGPTA